jgi:colicin import membrane protein
MNEVETRAEHIAPAWVAAGTRGKPLTADYVLEYRNTKLAVVCTFCFVLACVLSSHNVQAQTVQNPESRGTPRERANVVRSEAERAYDLELKACWQKTLVSDCMAAAKAQKAAALKEATRLEGEGRAAEQEIRLREREAKAKQQAADIPKREAEEAARSEKFRNEKVLKDAKRAEKHAADAAASEQRSAKAQTDNAARLRKQQKLDAADAAPAQKNSGSNRAEREKEQAERAAKIDERKKNYANELKRREADKAAKAAAEAAQAAAKENAKSSPLCCLWSKACCGEPAPGK